MFNKIKNIWLYLIGFRTSKKRVYIFSRTLWYQDELNYEEDGRVKDVIKTVLGGGFDIDKFGEAIDTLYDKGAIPGLFSVILKPYAPTFLHRWWNRAFMPAAGIIPAMKNSEIAAVLRDFFLFNTSWIADLTNLLPGLGSKTIATVMTSIFPAVKK